jgi:hypothetical protein
MAKGFFEKLNDYKAEKPKPKKAKPKKDKD